MELIQYDIADMIMEKPLSFTVKDERFSIYPLTLGKSLLIQRVVDNLEINEETVKANPFLEALRLCRDKKDLVLKLIAYYVTNDKERLFDERLINSTAKYLSDVDEEDLAKLLLYILTNDKVDACIKYLGIDKDRKEQRRILKIKNSGSNVVDFGGKSIYGSIVDVVCERYGWTMDYVVWGISYANLRMLLADMTTSISLTDDEKKKARIRSNGSFINGDDPANIDRMRAMFPD